MSDVEIQLINALDNTFLCMFALDAYLQCPSSSYRQFKDKLEI